MKKMIVVILALVALSACAHKDLKAPCADIASLAAGNVPCDERVPVNTTLVPSVLAQRQ